MKVIDVSTWQENLDYAKIKADGIEGIIIRAGFGVTLDNEFYTHMKGALKAGFEHIGAYWFGYACNEDEARAEANRADSILKEYKDILDLGVYYDWEYDSEDKMRARGIAPTKSLVTSLNHTFCVHMTECGYKAGYYLNLDYASRLVDETKLTAYRRWLAMWTNSCDEECFIWQYTEKGHIEGITQARTGYNEKGEPYTYYEPTFDLNELMGELPKPQPAPKPRTDYGVTYRVCVDDVWQSWVGDGETAGTQGQGKAFEAVQCEGGYGQDIDISYQLNVETNGDLAICSKGAVCGTEGLNRGARAMRIWATGKQIEIRGYCQKTGWTQWVDYGKWVGNPNGSMRLEAIQIRIKKGGK